MRVFSQGAWLDGFIPYHAGADDLRIVVTHWAVLARVEGLYFERPRSLRMVANYLFEVGPGEVWKKIRSRRAEGLRNRKYLSVGKGWYEEAGERRACAFIAFAHPSGVDLLALPREAVIALEEESGEDGLRHRDIEGAVPVPPALERLAGWSPMSGVPVSAETWQEARDEARRLVCDVIAWDRAPATVVAAPGGTGETVPAAGSGRAALYGLGNYAKVYVIPHIVRHLRLDRIAEVDPTQLPRERDRAIEWTTAPAPAPDDRFDAYFVAGYHHTHAPIAIHALSHGAAAVVEKPLAMDQLQLDALVAALRASPQGRLYAGYHKRYSKLTAFAREDLAAEPGEPIDYHCIVYEVPLPALHWYRWPNSHSRILSNGCHWIDHCLFLNDYSRPVSIETIVAPNGTMTCAAVLENGAVFSMVLTERGSERLGVRDHIELRSRDVTVRMTDGGTYHAENSQRVLRKARVNKTDSYRDMYAAIASAIASGAAGDSLKSVEIGAQAVLDAEAAAIERYPHLFARHSL